VVASVAVLCAVGGASAADPARQVDRLVCSQKCDGAYESCMRWRSGKGTQDCQGDILRCKQVCDPGGEGAAAAAKNARPRSCREACLADFSDCVGRDDGKRRQDCAQTVMVCRQGCPPEPDDTAAAPEMIERRDSIAPSTRDAAPPPAAREAMPARDAMPPSAREVAPPPSTREQAVEHVAPAPKPAAAERAPVARAAAAEPEPAPVPPRDETETDVPASASRGNVFARAWCAVSGSCRAVGDTPLSCEERCDETYDACTARANPKRGGECAPALMRCRQGCEDTTVHTAP
jgi:hypothetical protein